MKTHKICVLGDFGVGKTSLIRRYVFNAFAQDYHATLGVNLYKYEDEILFEEEPLRLRFMIWDVEGAAEPGPHAERYVIGASGALIVGDATRATALRTVSAYAERFEEQAPGRPFALAFNKADLVAAPDARERLGLPDLEDRFGVEPLLTSALTGAGVREAFRKLGTQVLAYGL